MTYNKYHAKKTMVGDLLFDSGKEACRYRELLLLCAAGEISCLERQPRYPLIVNGKKIGEYRGDFRYTECATGKQITEDVKGVKTPVYRLKKKLVKAIYQIDIIEV
jgi:hypothetical protein